ncbi:glycoside hydrolase family 1 protein [Micromonospora sp. C31]|uniref:glycoside hydrolase family 1 protein n=1 Tax=Micromonospora sp. C31 TaxID=2824876 RepID=UPI001B360FA5|nr:family 1 glycosylhydrolase [Micromonospora sp. C31]MBQ1076238.1 glycoside hydrolase family 1 protein [Micromonospora sp. C31]
MKRLITAGALLAVVGLALSGTPVSETTPDGPAARGFPGIGSIAAGSGNGSFRFGVSSSATQIEDRNPNTDWYRWTAPKPEGLAKSPFVGDAAGGYTRALADVELIAKLGVDSYRFGIEWARIEPRRDVIDEAALAHYDRFIDALLERGIRPMVTVHHFASPIWVDDPADVDCAKRPGDANLCGLDHPKGGRLVVAEMAEHARLLADRYGDRVDEWVTVNEPMGYMTFSHAFGVGPPGKANLDPEKLPRFTAALRSYLDAHAAMYRMLKKHDRIDADGDGVAAAVGLTTGAQDYVPVRDGKISADPRDVAARDRFRDYFDFKFVDAIWKGRFDADLDGHWEERQPQWRGTLDWLGPQLYARQGVHDPAQTPDQPAYPVIDVGFCSDAPCLPVEDESYWVPTMGYHASPQGLHRILTETAERYPGLPLVVTESGIATRSGTRRAEHLVRALEQIERVRAEGVDVRGYYHWALMDNFEWLAGYPPRFGLYEVDRTTLARRPTEAVDVYARITAARDVSTADRQRYGGDGPLSPEPAS